MRVEGSRFRHLILVVILAMLASACAQNEEPISEADLAPRNESTKIYAADNSLITTLRQEENREIIPLSNIPEHVRQAVVAIEDARFYSHKGFDAKAILRAVYVNATSGRVVEGGSTITQQLVRNSLKDVGKEQTIQRKTREASYAYRVEASLTKDKILELYLNTVYFGEGAYGVQTAAQTYFGKDVKDLTLQEGAMLAGLIKAPVNYDPYTNPDQALRRRNLVLDRMYFLKFSTYDEIAGAKGAPLGVQKKVEHLRYPAPYFVDYVTRQIQHSNLFASLGENVAARGDLLFRGGLRIYTTLDPKMQTAAETAISKVLDHPDRDPSATLVAMDPKDGYVKALVGGRDYFAPLEEDPCARAGAVNLDGSAKSCAKVNLALGREGGGTGRQPGSAFKPFVLAAALDKGLPLTKTYSAPSCIDIPGADAGGPWHVCNYEDASFGGSLSITDGTVKSVNTVYAQIIMDVGPKNVTDLAEKMGIREGSLEPVPSVALGSKAVSPLDMTAAYSVLPNLGTYVKPVAITKITDSRGNILWKPEPAKKRVLPEAVSYLTLEVLQQVIARGTASRNGRIGRPAFGKTGTAQEWRDAWFVGGAGTDLVAAVSVFWPDGEISMKPSCDPDETKYTISGGVVRTPSCRATRIRVAGGTWPTQIWQIFMLQALADTPASLFPVPEISKITVQIDVSRGCLPNPYTPTELIKTQTYIRGTEPTEICTEPSGPALSRVPSVIGYPEDDAIRLLQNSGFSVVRLEDFSGLYPPGRVLRQEPEPGTDVSPGAKVTIWIETKGVEVPDVINMTAKKAQQAIEGAGLKVKFVWDDQSCKSNPADEDCFVWDQDPDGGTQVPKGAVVTIRVKRKPPPSPSPSPQPSP